MSGRSGGKQSRFNHSDALTGIGFAIIFGLSAVFYTAGHQPAGQPSITWSDAPTVATTN